jgi:hypothetical protein
VRASALLSDYFSPISGANERKRGAKLIKEQNYVTAILAENSDAGPSQVVNVMVGLSVYKFAYCIRLVVHVQLFIISFVLFCYRLTVDVTESGTQFLERELIMFVRSVHYSDYLEQDLCIQDDITIGYPLHCVLCQVNWCLAVRDKKFMHNMTTGHSHTTKTCLSDIIRFSLHLI